MLQGNLLSVHAGCEVRRTPPSRSHFSIIRSAARHFEIAMRITTVYDLLFPVSRSMFLILVRPWRPADGIYLTHVSFDVIVNNDNYYLLISRDPVPNNRCSNFGNPSFPNTVVFFFFCFSIKCKLLKQFLIRLTPKAH